ncbi:predicted protein [Streptomyces pristinaespiralis ATCC 25486]|uniref:Predicted protein n=1 Tax=Streptomyces pristinaespiralis (strain ATCC 25486 / DSM 40338 / CBS 914.69 / JCM 4507 / KCC S-0507 / NBRC 13074 / NRRL 2958 / 5647) TaxID=457429 RepID=D6X8A8_STRE2|nr:predicted protein [Streptomyces pristinaespiralis ATCC 25486]
MGSSPAAAVPKAMPMNQLPPDPMALHPFPDQPRVVLLKPLVTSPLIEVGEYSYYDDPDDPTAFETRNVLYHYGSSAVPFWPGATVPPVIAWREEPQSKERS